MSVTFGNQRTAQSPGVGTTSAQPALDRDHLATYTLGDVTLEREVLQLFRDHAIVQIAQLRDAAGDPERWRAVAHGIKGSARGIGAWSLGQVAEHAEQASSQSAPIHMRYVELVSEQLAATNAEIDVLLACAGHLEAT